MLTLPNALSALRLLGVPVFLWAILDERDGLAIVLLFMASGLTDYLDGKIARHYGLVSRVGQLLDPVADRLYIVTTLLGLAWRDIMPWWLVGVLFAREVFMGVVVLVAKRHGWVGLPVHFAGKAATFNLLCAFPLLLLGAGNGALGARSPSRSAGGSRGGGRRCTGWPASSMPCSCASSSRRRRVGARMTQHPPSRQAPRRVDDPAHHGASSGPSTPATPPRPTAARRPGEPRSTSLRSPLLVVATLVIGLVMGVAAYNLTAASTPRSKARAELITQIEDRRSQVDELTARATTLQSQVTDLEAEQLGGRPGRRPQPRPGGGRRGDPAAGPGLHASPWTTPPAPVPTRTAPRARATRPTRAGCSPRTSSSSRTSCGGRAPRRSASTASG